MASLKTVWAFSREFGSDVMNDDDNSPLHIDNISVVPSSGAVVALHNLPKETSHLEGELADVLSLSSQKSSSGSLKLLVKLRISGKRVSIPVSM